MFVYYLDPATDRPTTQWLREERDARSLASALWPRAVLIPADALPDHPEALAAWEHPQEG